MSQENVNIERVGGAAVTTAVPVSGSVTVTGVATAANQTTEIASLANLDVALSTRTKPTDQQHTIVDSATLGTVTVTGALTDTQLRATAVPVSVSGVATAANQATEISSLANLDAALSTRLKPADTLAGVTAVGSITSALPSGTNALGSVTTSPNPSVTITSNEALLLSSLLFEIRMLRQAFQDWSGTNPRYDATQNPFSVQ